MRVRREKTKFSRLVAAIGVILVLAVTGIMAYENSALRKLERVGYSHDEAQTILGVVKKADLATILEQNYDARTDDLVSSPEFRIEKLSEYMMALPKYSFEVDELLALVNHPDYDQNEQYSDLEREILQEKYYLSHNYTRYLRMARDNRDNDKESSAIEIVAMVNSNRDRDYYTMAEQADTSADNLVLVNKYYYLEPDYMVDIVTMDAAYGQLGVTMERETYEHFQMMAEAALADGIQLYVTSGYRDYADQEEVFAGYLAEGGEDYALAYAAKPGYSEHQTGRALDIFTPGMTLTSFAGTKGANWLANEAYKYGFVLRYPEDKVDLTGYEFEPWHYRYVGEEAAREIFEEKLTLEEYYAYRVAKN